MQSESTMNKILKLEWTRSKSFNFNICMSFFLAKVDKRYKVSYFHEMTKKRGGHAHFTHVSHFGTFGARQTEVDRIWTTPKLWTTYGQKDWICPYVVHKNVRSAEETARQTTEQET